MLFKLQSDDIARVLDIVVGQSNPVRSSLESWAAVAHPDIPPTTVLTDNLLNPNAILLMGIDWLSGWSTFDDIWKSVFINLAMGEGELPDGFPGYGAWRGGSISSPELMTTPYIFLNQATPALARGAVEAGFLPYTESVTYEPAAHLWYIKGEPRFSEFVKHHCVSFSGTELFETIRRGWPHGDKDSSYLKWCLKAGPSFACIVDDEIVCASSTHLSRTMGMIYTPEEHRGKGFGSSLTAYQTDEMLKLDGIASAHIWHDNYASQTLVKKLGFEQFEGYFGWWRFYFPETRFLPSKRS